MGGNDSDQAHQIGSQTVANEKNKSDRFDIVNQSDLSQSRSRATLLYNQQLKAYTDLAKDNGGDTSSVAGSGGGGGGGGSAAPAYSAANDPLFGESENNYRGFSKTGGWDPNRIASLDSDIAGLKKIGETGGVDDEGVARIRGGGVFDEFAKTGGISDADKNNIRSRATSVIPAAYARMQAENDRARVAQGGYGPGAAALQSRLMRQQQSGISDAARDAELGITSQVNEGRKWGAGSMSTAELGLADLTSKNKINSLMGAGNLETGMVSDINKGKMFGVAGLEGMAQANRNADLTQQGINASRAASGAANAQFDQMLKFNRQNASAQGLNSLYTSIPAEYFGNKDFDLKNRQLTNQTNIGVANMMTGNNAPSTWANIVGAGASVANTYLNSQNQ
jgi:hypothetical protein